MDYTENFDDYDLDYEIQYIAFMLKLLDPYIVFDLFKDNDDSLSGQETLTISAPTSTNSFICLIVPSISVVKVFVID